MRSSGVRLAELRVLEGPNLYFTRPAIKVTLDVPGWLDADERRTARLAERVGLRGRPTPGRPGTGQRLRYLARVAGHVARRLARASGARVGVRSRPGSEPGQVVIAFPWRRREAAQALGRAVAGSMGALLDGRRRFDTIADETARDIRAAEPGPSPSVPVPGIPVIQVTGTNGKTTTVRLLAHLARTAGLRVAFTTTDGVYVGEERVEEGDYSGPGGAAMALAQPGVEIAIFEVARGGILLKGIGTTHNDVAVVTNISADHLGLHGIHTLDQLAEVKATITRITRPEGWDVLNADDPRVLAMRRQARGRPFLFSLDPDHPAVRGVLSEGGRALAPVDGDMTLMAPGPSLLSLVPLEDVPVTLAGISSHFIQNAMAATAAALGVGLPREDVVRGLRSFVLDPERNPGRANLFEIDGRVVVVDYAHNEAGMSGLVEIARGLRPSGARVWLAFGSAGDRTDDILEGMGTIAARGADRVILVEMHKYLRGREPDDVLAHLRAGCADAGVRDVPDFPDELAGLRWMLERSKPGDVVAITALAQRPEVFAFLEGSGASRIGPERCRELARRAATGLGRRPGPREAAGAAPSG
jgi:cyanophycin synthetase